MMEATLMTKQIRNEDDALVARCLAGEAEAFRSLVERHQHSVFSIALRMVGNREEAMDLAQETFVRAFASLRRYRPDGRFEAWLRRIVTNLCLNHLRRPPSVSLEEVELDEATDSDPARIFLAQEKAHAIQQAIDNLPPDYRAVIVLRFTEGLSYREMSEVLNLPESTIDTRLHRAKKMLRQRLKRVIEDEMS